MGSISIPTVAALGSAAAEGGADAAAAGAATSITADAVAGAAANAAIDASATVAGSSIFTAGNALAAAGLAGSAVSAYGQRQAGVAASNMDKQKARVEQINETQNQINLRQKMLAGLASQNAGTLGAVGTGIGSGFGANAMRQITQSQNDLAVSSANESAQVSLLDQAGSNATAQGNLGAAGTAISGLSGFYKNSNFGGS